MRDLRFRAFDKVTKQMSPSFSLFGEFTLLGAVHDWQHECGNPAKTSLEALGDLEVMQWSGLEDSYIVDIYEKDICKILYTDWPSKSSDDPRTIDQYMEDIAKVGVIEYSQDGFYFVTKDRRGELNYSHILPGTHGFIKVIGNVFQNPELL
jgi:uncharacterized phage protein (TIGR01671 family)